MTRETRSLAGRGTITSRVVADLRVEPADLACWPAGRTRGSENDTKVAASCTKASLVPGRYSDRMLSKRPEQSYQPVTYLVPGIKHYYANTVSDEAVGIIQVYCRPSKSTKTS